MSDFHSEFIRYYNENNDAQAHKLIISELAKAFISKRKDFVDLLNESNLYANEQMTDNELIRLYVNNVDSNKKLRVGTALLINLRNKKSSFDGKSSVDKDSVLATMEVMEDFYAASGGDPVSAIAKAVEEGAKLGSHIAQGQQKKKYGIQDIAAKRMETQAELTKLIYQQKLQEREKKDKQTRMIVIVSASIVALVIIAAIVIKKKAAKK